MGPTTAPSYHLVRPSRSIAVPGLDEQQRRVVEHAGGPLLVLAGPGTGKTTTLVEAIVRRIDEGTHPDSILALTFSRKAAEQLRDRVAARVGRTMSASIGSTFHSFAYGLIRRYAPAELYVGPLRLLSAPEQDVVLRELLQDHPESIRWPDGPPARARHPRVRPRGPRRAVPGPGEGARRRGAAAAGRGATACPSSSRPGRSSSSTSPSSTAAVPSTTPTSSGAPRSRRPCTATSCARPTPTSSSTSTRTPTPARWRCSGPSPVTAATWWWWATRTSRSTPSGVPRCAASSTSRPTSRARTARRPRWWRWRRPGGSGRGSSPPPSGSRGGSGCPGSIPEEAREAFLSPRADGGAHGEGRVVVRTFDSDRAEAEHLADLLRRAHLEDGIAWDEMAVLVRSGRQSIPPLRRSLGAAGVPVEVASDEVPLVRDPAALPLIDALRVVLNLDNDDPDHVDHIDAARAEALLTGPLGGPGRRRRTPSGPAAAPAGEGARARRAAAAGPLARAGPPRRAGRRPPSTGSTGPEVQRARAVGDLVRTHPRPARRGRDRRGAAVGALVRHGVAAPAAPAGSSSVAGAPGGRTATSTRSAPCSTRRPGPRRRATTSASASSWPPSSPSRSRPTPWPSGAPAAPPYAC